MVNAMNAPAVLFADRNSKDAPRLAEMLKIPFCDTGLMYYKDGDSLIHLPEDTRCAHAILFQPARDRDSRLDLDDLALQAYALRKAGAARITAVIPYIGTGWTHTAFSTMPMTVKLLSGCGIDGLVSFRLPSGLAELLPFPVREIRAEDVFGPILKRQTGYDNKRLVVCSAGDLPAAAALASFLETGLSTIEIYKDLYGLHILLPEDPRDRDVVFYADRLADAITLTKTRHLMFMGARSVTFATPHIHPCILRSKRPEEWSDTGITEILALNTINSLPSDLPEPEILRRIDIVPFLAGALEPLL